MPIYEYECPKCGNVFEEWGKATEPHHKEACPVCGEPSPRVISRTSFVLKGDGWYVSDYGYRKGIKDDAGGVADAPLPHKTTTPAKQGDKSLAVQKDKSLQKAEDAPAAKKATKPEAKAESKPAAKPAAVKKASGKKAGTSK